MRPAACCEPGCVLHQGLHVPTGCSDRADLTTARTVQTALPWTAQCNAMLGCCSPMQLCAGQSPAPCRKARIQEGASQHCGQACLCVSPSQMLFLHPACFAEVMLWWS